MLAFTLRPFPIGTRAGRVSPPSIVQQRGLDLISLGARDLRVELRAAITVDLLHVINVALVKQFLRKLALCVRVPSELRARRRRKYSTNNAQQSEIVPAQRGGLQNALFSAAASLHAPATNPNSFSFSTRNGSFP